LKVFLFGLAVLHGLVVNLMPVMFSSMEATFQADKARQALLKSYFFGGSAVALVAAGYATQYFGVRRTCILLAFLAGSGAVAFGLAPTYSLVLAATAVLAIGIAPLAAIYAAIIAAHFHKSRQRMYMLTYALLAVSATIATTALGALLDRLGRYQEVFLGLGIVIWVSMAALLAIGWQALGRQAEAAAGAPVQQDLPTGGESVSPGLLLRVWAFLGSGVFTRGALYLMCALMIFDYLFASNMLAWTPTFFEGRYGSSKLLAGSALSASSAGVAVGRMLMAAFPPGKVADRVLLAGCYAGGVICFGLMILLQLPYPVSLFLMFVSGGFIAAQAPTMGSLAVAKFGDRAPIAVPIYEAVGTLAGIFGPPVVGYFADRTGQLEAILLLVPAAGLALAAVAGGWEFYDRRRHNVVFPSGSGAPRPAS
jgi:MFS family permease